ncbi:N-acetyltransferase [Myxosarcina sp. GI1]|uniref:GNAT family N-acetyltransferase n=1 Tax=Myxosarcina sp. GI1 TaxID=1541065 RepID=UPI000689450F|nr:GNAT family N-acetyltransferase [Myxosarcina sp. GI1]
MLLASQERGAVIWYPAEVNVFDEAFVDVEAKINTIAADFNEFGAIKRLEQIGKKVQPIAPAIPHHEIFWLATIPEFRGQGIGSGLLKLILDDADAQKAGCYLVSSNPNNILFYKARGFQQYSLISINSKLTLIAMWRGSYPSNFTLITNN